MQAFVGPGEALIIKEGERARGRGCDLRKRESSGAKMRRLRDGAGVLECWSAGVRVALAARACEAQCLNACGAP